MSTCGHARAASACASCARPISPPSGVTAALSAMFCALNGATRTPRRAQMRQSAVHRRLLPTDEAVPCTMIVRSVASGLHRRRPRRSWSASPRTPTRTSVGRPKLVQSRTRTPRASMRRGEAARVADVGDDEGAAGGDGADAEGAPAAPAAGARSVGDGGAHRLDGLGERGQAGGDRRRRHVPRRQRRLHGARHGAGGDEVAEPQPGQREQLGQRAQHRHAAPTAPSPRTPSHSGW